ncbi:MAG TPA: hypothetical protein VH186_01145 [Chloroflexia bacterium]|nr:hypothetical protein [Chloroflexia bacterium]
MTLRGDFLSKVRTELGDTDATAPVWSADLLAQFLEDGLFQLGIDLPPLKEYSLPAVVGQRDYVLDPAELVVGPGGVLKVEVDGVEVSPGESYSLYPTSLFCYSGLPFDNRWEFFRLGGQPSGQQMLRFRYALSRAGTITVRAYSVYSLPASDGEAFSDLTAADEQLLKWLVCWRAYAWLDEQKGKRSGQSVAGSRGSQGYYQRLYNTALASRQRAEGVKSYKVVLNG